MISSCSPIPRRQSSSRRNAGRRRSWCSAWFADGGATPDFHLLDIPNRRRSPRPRAACAKTSLMADWARGRAAGMLRVIAGEHDACREALAAGHIGLSRRLDRRADQRGHPLLRPQQPAGRAVLFRGDGAVAAADPDLPAGLAVRLLHRCDPDRRAIACRRAHLRAFLAAASVAARPARRGDRRRRVRLREPRAGRYDRGNGLGRPRDRGGRRALPAASPTG